SMGIRPMRQRLTQFLPGYLFVRFDPTTGAWRAMWDLRGISAVTFAERPDQAVAIDDALIERLRSKEKGGAIVGATPAEFFFKLGEEVRIVNGPFATFPGFVEELPKGPIESIDATSRLKLTVSIFGRPTPVGVELWQIAKL